MNFLFFLLEINQIITFSGRRKSHIMRFLQVENSPFQNLRIPHLNKQHYVTFSLAAENNDVYLLLKRNVCKTQNLNLFATCHCRKSESVNQHQEVTEKWDFQFTYDIMKQCLSAVTIIKPDGDMKDFTGKTLISSLPIKYQLFQFFINRNRDVELVLLDILSA